VGPVTRAPPGNKAGRVQYLRPMHPSESEPVQDDLEKDEADDFQGSIEDLDIPADLKAELLRDLDTFKEH